ncbi:MAG: ABC transporter ATP-binding protein [Candidatus Algichlamydia australiensis]|nr:ABC transporter ATP-binding protein [Chlamydiales bacterium]
MLQIQQVTKSYKTKGRPIKRALKGVSLEIQKGEVLGLLGVNGAGKTTLSSIIAGLIPPTSGDLIWGDRSIYKDIVGYKRHIGFCPQSPNLDQQLNLGQSLLFTARCYGFSKERAKKRCEELTNRFGLGNYLEASPFQLSGGYKQRFLLARALIHGPDLVILDEPTVGLDPHIRHELWEEIKGLRKSGVAVLLTTHYLDEAEELSDRVCFIHNGEIRIVDKPQNLITKYKKKNLEEVFLELVDTTEMELFKRDE